MRSKELKVYNLPTDKQALAIIDAKPYGLLMAVLVLGVCLILFRISTMYGIATIVVGSCAIMFLPKTILVEFYDDHLVLHNKASKDDCVIIYYEDVTSFIYVRGSLKDYLEIALEDGSIEKVEAYSRIVFEAYMNHYCPGKIKTK